MKRSWGEVEPNSGDLLTNGRRFGWSPPTQGAEEEEEGDIAQGVDCPICSMVMTSQEQLARHVNQHLDDDEMARDAALAQGLQQQYAPVTERHRQNVQGEVQGSGASVGTNGDQQQSNEAEFRQKSELPLLNEKPGTSSVPPSSRNQGGSEIDQEQSTSTGTEQTEEERAAVRRRQMAEDELVKVQKPGEYVHIREGIMVLLKQCLDVETTGFSRAALSGYVDHYESRKRGDLGWGCGWRNIQMLCSHLVKNEAMKAVLFGGVGFVPEIADLQQWLEIAWKKGYDEMGAEQLGWQIQGSHKWIGTTECAALLRSFGLRARIVDFKSRVMKDSEAGAAANRQRGSQQQTIPRVAQETRGGASDLANSPRGGNNTSTSAASSGSNNNKRPGSGGGKGDKAVVHPGVQCDGCGMQPIRGPRYRSHLLQNFDLCRKCKDNFKAEGREWDMDDAFDCIEEPAKGEDSPGGAADPPRGGGGGQPGQAVSGAHMRLVEWVWRYFSEGGEKNGKTSVMTELGHSVILSNRPPLYFQHEGHSRTIVGIERRKLRAAAQEEVFLLVLDPSQKTDDLAAALWGRRGWQRLMKRGVHTLRKPEYQLCYVEPGVATGEELEDLKTLDSVLHSY